MIVLFLSFVSSMILVKSELAQIENTQLKDQLQKSLTHVNEMLADIEDKIESERKILSQIDYDLNYKDTPSGFMDYPVTDIWWPSKKPPTGSEPNPTVTQSQLPSSNLQGAIRSQQKLTAINTNTTHSLRVEKEPLIQDIVANWVHSMTNLPELDLTQTSTTPSSTARFWTPTIPPTTTTTTVATTTSFQTTTTTEAPTDAGYPPGVPQGWPFENTPTPGTSTSEFVRNLNNDMEKSTFGPFTVGLTKFLELLSTKETGHITPVLDGMEVTFGKLLNEHKLDSFGPTLQRNLLVLLGMMNSLPPALLQKQANVGNYALQNKNVLASPQTNKCLDQYDSMFQPNEADTLFRSLEQFFKFPAGGQKASEVSEDMLNAVLEPFLRNKGTRDQRRLISCINEAIQAHYPDWRTRQAQGYNDTSMITDTGTLTSSLLTNETSAQLSNVTGDPLSGLPSRRRMGHDFEKLMHHFLTKHRKLFKRLNEHHKYNKRKKHHHLRHKIRHHTYHKKHKKHQNEHHSQDKHDSHEQHEKHEQHVQYDKYKQPLRKTGQQIMVKRAKEDDEDSSGSDAFFQTSKKKRKSIPIPRNTSRQDIEIVPKVAFNKNYLMELAKQFKLKMKNKYNRRFIVTSSEKESDIKKAESSTKNKIVHKIREASSYSDEEYHLKTNLYDALRHGNRTFVQLHNGTIPETSDEELIIKNNLYKVF